MKNDDKGIKGKPDINEALTFNYIEIYLGFKDFDIVSNTDNYIKI